MTETIALARNAPKAANYAGIKYHNNILRTIGNTPLIKMNRLNEGLLPLILGKMEFLNPGGSSKDRIGIAMIEAAEGLGLLKPGGTIIEPTSGNTGIGLAQAAVVKGYKVIFTMNAKVCQEKRNILKAYGAEVVVCPCGVAPDDPRSYYKVAERLVEETPNAFSPNQYANPNNPLAHYLTTGPEIWRDTAGQITHFIAGMGTGGTITGTGEVLKSRKPSVKVVAVEPAGSPVLSGGEKGPHPIQGIGAGFIPSNLHTQSIDGAIQVDPGIAFGQLLHAGHLVGQAVVAHIAVVGGVERLRA